MSNQNQRCPNCGAELTELKGGLRCCPVCGFEGDKPKIDSKASSRVIFWIALIAPATMALASFLVGRSSDKLRDTGAEIGVAALLVGFAASIYCGTWLAKRFAKSDSTGTLLGLFLVLGLILVNFFIIFAGCAGNVQIGQ